MMQALENLERDPLYIDKALTFKFDSPGNPVSGEIARAIADSTLSASGRVDFYTDTSELTSKLADYAGLEDRFVLPFGAEGDALEYVCRAYLDNGDEALIAGPVPAQFRSCAESCGALVRLELARDPFVSDLPSLAQSITPRTRLIYLMNPNYPSGAVRSNVEIERLLVSAPDALVIVDEAYFEFYGQTCSRLVRRYDNLIVIRRLAGALGMSVFPCSYALASPDILNCINPVRPQQRIAAPIQAGAIAALDHARLSAEYMRQVRENRTYLALGLRQFGIESKNTPTDSVLLKVSCPLKVVTFLGKRNILADDCSSMPQMDDCVCITVGDNEYCADVIQRFAEMPEDYYSFAPIESCPLTHRTNVSASQTVSRTIVKSARGSERRLVFNRGIEAASVTVFADVAGRLSRTGASRIRRPAAKIR